MSIADRHAAALERIATASPIGPAPLPVRTDRVDLDFPPRIPRPQLDAEALRRGIDSAGCVFVPSLLDEEVAVGLATDIERVFRAYDRHGGGEGTGDPWFDAFIPGPGLIHSTRPWLRQGGGIFTPDSPRMADRWFGLTTSLGVVQLVTDFFGEVPVTSLDKCALRRINSGDGIEWHQDGAFLGIGSGALNLWVSLSDTQEAPGLDIVSHRFTEVVEPGTGGAGYDWSVGPDVVAKLAESWPVAQPHFRPGDALIFDGMLLHRTTQPPPALSRTRYAIETWFFRPSVFPDHQQVPIAF
jgi:hypothetical protein